jgi:GDP-4-dehydro-6-deoxy-D-mannose reductase
MNRNPNPEQEPGTRNAEHGTVLVTGAGGFAGSHLMDRLPGAVGWTRRDVDLLDRDAVRARIRDLKPSVVYHCAGAPHVAHSWADTTHPLANNVLATHYLLDALRRSGRPCRVLIPGSAYVYGGGDAPIPETAAVAPANPYALSKLAQEQLGIRSVEEDGIDVIVTRSFNHTGPRQTPSFAAPAFARQLARIEARLDPPVIYVGNLDVRRDMTDVRDTVRAYELLVERGRPATPYNVCSGVARSIRELLDALLSRVQAPVRVEVDPTRLRRNDTRSLVGDPSRLMAETGWTPEIPFATMLDDLLGFWRQAVARVPQ